MPAGGVIVATSAGASRLHTMTVGGAIVMNRQPQLENPMTDNDNPPPSTESADIAAEAIRTLNYSSRSDLRDPSDVYSVLGSLSQLAERLPQALQQLTSFLDRELANGVIRHDEGTVAASTAVAATRRALLDEAVPSAQQVRAALDRAQQAIGELSSTKVR